MAFKQFAMFFFFFFQVEGIIWLIVLFSVYTLYSASVAHCCSLYKENVPLQLFVTSMKLTECSPWYDWFPLIILYWSACFHVETQDKTTVSSLKCHGKRRSSGAQPICGEVTHLMTSLCWNGCLHKGSSFMLYVYGEPQAQQASFLFPFTVGSQIFTG